MSNGRLSLSAQASGFLHCSYTSPFHFIIGFFMKFISLGSICRTLPPSSSQVNRQGPQDAPRPLEEAVNTSVRINLLQNVILVVSLDPPMVRSNAVVKFQRTTEFLAPSCNFIQVSRRFYPQPDG